MSSAPFDLFFCAPTQVALLIPRVDDRFASSLTAKRLEQPSICASDPKITHQVILQRQEELERRGFHPDDLRGRATGMVDLRPAFMAFGGPRYTGPPRGRIMLIPLSALESRAADESFPFHRRSGPFRACPRVPAVYAHLSALTAKLNVRCTTGHVFQSGK